MKTTYIMVAAMLSGPGYGVSDNVKIFGDFAWTRASASELSVGTVATLDLRARFGDYTSYGLDAGMRYHFAPAAGVPLPDTPFFSDSTVPVFGGDAGVLIGVSPRWSAPITGVVRFRS